MYKEAIKTAGAKMDKTIEIIEKDLSTLRAGRANPQILDKITVDYYGTPTHLNQIGNISSPEPRMLVIAPWEPKMIAEIEKAMADHAAEIAADPAQRMRWQSSAGVDPETAPFVLRTIRQDYGSAESYLEAEYGLTPARLMRLRRMYLE